MESGITVAADMTNGFTQALQNAAVWLIPFVLLAVFVVVWTIYVRIRTLSLIKPTLLDVPISGDASDICGAVTAVVSACENVKCRATFFDLYIRGSLCPRFSLELVFHKGVFRFFVWTDAHFKDILVREISARLRGIAPKETKDYADEILNKQTGIPIDIFVSEYAPYNTRELSAKHITYTDIFESGKILGLARPLGSGESLCAQLILHTQKNASTLCDLRIVYIAGKVVFQKERQDMLLEPFAVTGDGESGILLPWRNTARVSLWTDFFSISGLLGALGCIFSVRLEPMRSAMLRAKKSAMLDAYVQRSYFYQFSIRKSFLLAREKRRVAAIPEIMTVAKDISREVSAQAEYVVPTPAPSIRQAASEIIRLPPENLPV